MPVTIRAIQPTFAGEVSGIDITQPVSPADVAAIEAKAAAQRPSTIAAPVVPGRPASA